MVGGGGNDGSSLVSGRRSPRSAAANPFTGCPTSEPRSRTCPVNRFRLSAGGRQDTPGSQQPGDSTMDGLGDEAVRQLTRALPSCPRRTSRSTTARRSDRRQKTASSVRASACLALGPGPSTGSAVSLKVSLDARDCSLLPFQ